MNKLIYTTEQFIRDCHIHIENLNSLLAKYRYVFPVPRGGYPLASYIAAQLNKEMIDIETPVILGNIKILPYSYHRCWDDGEIKYVYHAGGNTPTKFERIKKILC